MTLDSLRTAAEARRAKMQTPGEPDCSYHGLDGCDEAEAALDTALALIDRLVAAGEDFVGPVKHEQRPASTYCDMCGLQWPCPSEAWRALLAEMGKS